MVWMCEADVINGDTYVCASQILLSISFMQKVTGMGDGFQVARVWAYSYMWFNVMRALIRGCLDYGYVTSSVGSM